ncbi:GNAT acetyltransferase 2-domain-containing protein [Melampsora americana]|nr:GNAT acetyltransferase 2-domain-containing protein [Melampsora americana]
MSNSTSTRKRLDPRIQSLIKNSVKTNHRSFFIILGDKSKDQIVNLHFLLSQSRHTARPNVLWCYKKELGFTSNRKKREQKIKRDVKRGQREIGDMDPFELFVSLTDIRYTYYKDTEKILGQTFGMVVLQDFEALTPNLLARTIETVTGGGIVVLLLNTMKSLKQLYTMSMDVHERYRTEAYHDLVARFNERFLLSLGPFRDCLVLDDELNVLPISAGKDIELLDDEDLEKLQKGKGKSRQTELEGIKEDLKSTIPIGPIIQLTKTIDQAKALMEFTSSITEKTLSSTVALTAARGRGKSAALGLAITAAIAHSYSNIFVTSPSPENLKTVFEFIFKGLDAIGYEEHLDYDIHQSTNPDWHNCVVRIDIFRQHRQTIQYIEPQDYKVLGQAELVVIDEAAAIPIGFGTGRSLSLKLIAQLRELSRKPAPITAATNLIQKTKLSRSLKEIKLEEPIRYSEGDGVEKWLNELLCLDVQASTSSKTLQGCPHPSKCELYYVNRDTLFSYHPASEAFLRRMMSLYVASHYKNSPNDLQLMSDAPSHQLYVLLPPLKDEDHGNLPEPLVVIQIALEGKISRPSVIASLNRGIKASGDLIPWTISQQFQDEDFPTLSGARIIRIATHPDYCRMGYGARAMEILDSFFNGKLVNLDEDTPMTNSTKKVRKTVVKEDEANGNEIKARESDDLPALLERLNDRQPEMIDYLGVSFGLTSTLLKFWKKLGQTENELTGEHTAVMLRSLSKESGDQAYTPAGWLTAFALDFRKRFIALMSYKFREFSSITSLSILEAANAGQLVEKRGLVLNSQEISRHFTPFDLKRLESYSNNMLDYHVILDLLPSLTELYFSGQFNSETRLTGVQSSILLSLGLQRKSVEEIEKEIKLPVSQTLALFVKVVRKLIKSIQEIQKTDVASQLTLPTTQPVTQTSSNLKGDEKSGSLPKVNTQKSMVKELENEGDEVQKQLVERQRELIESLDISQYAIGGEESDWKQLESKLETVMEKDEEGLGKGLISVKNVNSSKMNKKRKGGGEEDGLNEKNLKSSLGKKSNKKHKKKSN